MSGYAFRRSSETLEFTMFKRRLWNGFTIMSYWHKGTKFFIAMKGRYATLDDMAAAVSLGIPYNLRVAKEN